MAGHKVFQVFRQRFDTWATAHLLHRPSSSCDLFEPDRLLCGVDAFRMDLLVRTMARVKPDAVVNCIGIIKHLDAAKDPITSLEINSLFPHRLANLCRACSARLIHMSTDCVFAGSKGMYSEDDPSDATDLYGRSKYLGEIGGPGCLTMRTSIIGRELRTSNGLVEWFMSNKGGKVRGFRRAIFTGYPTRVLAEIMADVLENHAGLEGVYQISSQPINKYDLLCQLNEAFGLGIEIEPDDDFVCDRSLDSSRFRAATGYRPPSWTEMVRDMAADATPYEQWRR